MSSQGVSRKRPAPGASPLVHQQVPSVPTYSNAPDPALSNDQFLQWGQNAPGAQNPIDANLNVNASAAAAQYQAQPHPAGRPDLQNMQQASNQLTRRTGNNELVSSRGRLSDPNMMPLIDQNALRQNEQGNEVGETEAELEQRALLAKKDAQAKRKQIPPFVQKLSSFLDESKNTDLIRWTEDGNSFIVLDEDEFARKLIPELFKHNNYASFVRQLNMYGFHKKVGLSDNSMRASERKNKSPSEYSNPYFRRGRPELLWLIQKPKNMGHGSKGSKSSTSRVKTEPEADDAEHDEPQIEESGSVPREDKPRFRGQLTLPPSNESEPSQDQLANVYQELRNIRQQQQIISGTINKLRREHEQLYGQAANFQEQHNRHENSINAILTFLATVYNRSLQGHEGAQGLVNSFAGAIPQDTTSQGNIVDVEDYPGTFGEDRNAPQRSFKRQPLLLKAPPTVGPDGRAPSPNTMGSGSSGNQYDFSQGRGRPPSNQVGSGLQSGNIEELYDTASPSNQSQSQPPQQEAQQNVPTDQDLNQNSGRYPQRDIMSLIQNSNARNNIQTTHADFPAVLSSLENSAGNSPLSAAQRADMLRLIANESNANNSSGASSNNALMTPNPPPMPQNYPNRLANTRAEIDDLVKMQAEQDRSVQNLTNLLQPLSPTGSIPGLDSKSNVPPPPLDLDQIFNSGDYFSDIPGVENKSGDASQGYKRDDQTGQTINPSGGGGGKDQTGGGAYPGANAPGSDLFDFDGLQNDSLGNYFGDPNNQDTTQQQRPPVPNYFDGFENFTGSNEFDPAGVGATAGSGLNQGSSSNQTGAQEGPSDGGRVVETFSGSEAASPTNASTDENLQGMDNSAHQAASSKGRNPPSNKRQRRNP